MGRVVFKLKLPDPIVNLILAALITSYMFYGFVKMPHNVEQPEVVFWTYAKGKMAEGLSSWAGLLHLGHPADVYRSVTSRLEEPIPKSHPLLNNINITDTVWNGVDVRLYQPSNMIRNGPAIMFYHGGLWFTGTLDNYDRIAGALSKSLGVLVVSVDYRLAPEHPYPIPLDDCYKATIYLFEESQELNIDTSMVALIGIDAGANIAAAVALKLRDRGRHLPQPEHQILINPVLQPFDFLTPSYQQNAGDAVLPKSLVVDGWLWYGFGREAHKTYGSWLCHNGHTSPAAKQSALAARVDHSLLHRKYLHESYQPGRVDHGDEAPWDELKQVFSDPYFAPLMADDLGGLPAGYVVAAEYDVTRDDGLMYARRLEKAGVAVTLQYYHGSIHNHLVLCPDTKVARTILNDLVDYLIQKL